MARFDMPRKKPPECLSTQIARLRAQAHNRHYVRLIWQAHAPLRSNAVQVPLVGYALEVMVSPVGESCPRSSDKVLDRSRHHHFVDVGERSDSCADVDSDSTNVVANNFDFACVDAGSDVHVQWP